MNLHGHKQRSIGSAWIIGFGSSGGVIATFTFLSAEAPYYHTGYSICLGTTVLGIVASLVYAGLVLRERHKADNNEGPGDKHVLSL